MSLKLLTNLFQNSYGCRQVVKVFRVYFYRKSRDDASLTTHKAGTLCWRHAITRSRRHSKLTAHKQWNTRFIDVTMAGGAAQATYTQYRRDRGVGLRLLLGLWSNITGFFKTRATKFPSSVTSKLRFAELWQGGSSTNLCRARHGGIQARILFRGYAATLKVKLVPSRSVLSRTDSDACLATECCCFIIVQRLRQTSDIFGGWDE